eukprot:320530_1
MISLIISLALIINYVYSEDCGYVAKWVLDVCSDRCDNCEGFGGGSSSRMFTCEDDIYMMYLYSDADCEVLNGTMNVTSECEEMGICYCGDGDECETFTYSGDYECVINGTEMSASVERTYILNECLANPDDDDMTYVMYECPESFAAWKDNEIVETEYLNDDCSCGWDDLYTETCSYGDNAPCSMHYKQYPVDICAEVTDYNTSTMYSCNGTAEDGYMYYESTYLGDDCGGDLLYTEDVSYDCYNEKECECDSEPDDECAVFEKVYRTSCDPETYIKDVYMENACIYAQYYDHEAVTYECVDDTVSEIIWWDTNCTLEEEYCAEYSIYDCEYNLADTYEGEEECGYIMNPPSLMSPIGICQNEGGGDGSGVMYGCDSESGEYWVDSWYFNATCGGDYDRYNLTDQCLNDDTTVCQCGVAEACSYAKITECDDESVSQYRIIGECGYYPDYEVSLYLTCNSSAYDGYGSVDFEFFFDEICEDDTYYDCEAGYTVECNEGEDYTDGEECGYYDGYALNYCQADANSYDESSYKYSCDNGTVWMSYWENTDCSGDVVAEWEQDECGEDDDNCYCPEDNEMDYCSTMTVSYCESHYFYYHIFQSETYATNVCMYDSYQYTC